MGFWDVIPYCMVDIYWLLTEISSFRLHRAGKKSAGESFVPTIMAEDLHFGQKMVVAYFLAISVVWELLPRWLVTVLTEVYCLMEVEHYYEAKSVIGSQVDIKLKICDIRNWRKKNIYFSTYPPPTSIQLSSRRPLWTALRDKHFPP
jgi:hypothetical protein